MRYLVTGGAGFIGSNTVDELVRRGHRVAVLDDLSTGKERNLACVRDKIEFIHGSITDLPTLERACREIDYVLHLGARTSVPRSVADPLETNRVNVDGTLNVLVAARDAGIRRVVFAGSSSVYGETPTLPKREDMPPAPISPYGLTKLVGELYGRVFHRVYGLDFVALRYFNVFGPRQDPGSPYSGVLSLFSTAMRDGTTSQPSTATASSRAISPLSKTSWKANLQAFEAQGVAGMVFNLGVPGARITLNQTLKLLEKFSGRAANAKYELSRGKAISVIRKPTFLWRAPGWATIRAWDSRKGCAAPGDWYNASGL